MFIKIYFDDIPVFLSDELDPQVNIISKDTDTLILYQPTEKKIKSFISDIRTGKFKTGILFHSNPEYLINHFKNNFTLIIAGGGIVKNKEAEILMIFRRGKWDLPKGKLDENELIDQCAIREVKEETGLVNIEIGSHLITTYHTYYEKGKSILKKTHWYHMNFYGSEIPKPQIEEQITKIEWAKIGSMYKYFQNTYPIIKEVIDLSINKSADSTQESDRK